MFYTSNRDTSETSSTIIHLTKLNLPDADTSHCLFLINESSKEARSQAVMKKYNVIMLLGDNLNDFTQAFEMKNIAGWFANQTKLDRNGLSPQQITGYIACVFKRI